MVFCVRLHRAAVSPRVDTNCNGLQAAPRNGFAIILGADAKTTEKKRKHFASLPKTKRKNMLKNMYQKIDRPRSTIPHVSSFPHAFATLQTASIPMVTVAPLTHVPKQVQSHSQSPPTTKPFHTCGGKAKIGFRSTSTSMSSVLVDFLEVSRGLGSCSHKVSFGDAACGGGEDGEG